MMLKPYTRVARQIVYNRKLEQIINYEDPNGEYVDPISLLNREILAEEISFEDADKIIPFLEILILRDTSTSFSYRQTMDSEKILTPSQRRQIDKCLRDELSAFEQEKFGTRGKLFYDESAFFEKLKIWQQEWREKIRSIRIIENAYSELMANITRMLKDGRRPVYIAKEFMLSEKKIKDNLYSTTSGKPTISTLVKKILEDSDAAKKLGIRDGQRLYDEIISRSRDKVFHKQKNYVISKKHLIPPSDPVIVDKD